MNCEDVQKYAYTYLDGEFDRRDRAEFEGHLAACPQCRSAVTVSASFREGVRRHLRCDGAPEALRSRICASLDEVEAGGGSSWSSYAMPLAMAAGLGIAVVGWQVMAPSPAAELPTATAVAGVMGVAGAAPVPVAAPVPAAAAKRVALGVRGSDPKRVGQHRPAMRIVTSLKNDTAYCEPERKAGGALRLVEHVAAPEVIAGGVGDDFLAEESPYGAIRTRSNLRALVASHTRPLPPEVSGSAGDVQRWLRRAAPGHSALPLAQGAGVRLLGARLGHVGDHRVVSFRYVAFDKAVTVVRYLPSRRDMDERDLGERGGDGRAAPQSGAVRDLYAGYSVVHTARDGEVLSFVSDLEHQALLGIIEPPKFL